MRDHTIVIILVVKISFTSFKGCWWSATAAAHDLILTEVDGECQFVVDSIVVRKDAWYDFSFLKFAKASFGGPACDHSWKMFLVHMRRMYVLLHLDWMLYKYQLTLMCHLRSVLPCWFSVWIIFPLMKVGFKVPHYYCVIVGFSFCGCYYLPYRDAGMLGTYIYNWYSFFLGWPLDCFVVLFFLCLF